MKVFALTAVCFVWLVLLAGCGGGSSAQQNVSTESSSSSPSASGSTAMPAASLYDTGPRAGESPVDEKRAEQGEKLFSSKGCTACHAFGRRVTGPDLAGVTMRRTAQWMENQILNPEKMVKEDPISHALFAQYALQMPNQHATPGEAQAIIEYFKHKDHEAHEAHEASEK